MESRKQTLPSLLEVDKLAIKSSNKPLNNKPQPLAAIKLPKQLPRKSQTAHGLNILLSVPTDNDRQSANLRRDSLESFAKLEQPSPDRKNLKKLYSDSMHKQFSEKLDDIRKKYDYVYKNVVKDSEVNVERGKIKDIVLQSENIFHTTYSIKYFGVKNNQIGILSKRVALPQKGSTRPEKTAKSMRDDQNNSKSRSKERIVTNSDIRSSEMPSKSLRTEKGNRKHSSSLEHQKLKEVLNKMDEARPRGHGDLANPKIDEETENTINEDFEDGNKNQKYRSRKSMDASYQQMRVNIAEIVEKNSEMRTKESLPRNFGESTFGSAQATPSKGALERLDDKESARVQFDENSIKTNLMGESDLKMYDAPEATEETALKEFDRDTDLGPTVRSPEGYMVTQYFLPRKLQGNKKSNWKEEKHLVGLKNNSKEQLDINNKNFERSLKSLSKVRRNMIRNVTAHIEDVYEDELDVLENFRTHEMKGITSNALKYSYSSLLKTLNSTQGLEDTFVEKDKKLQKLLQKRDQMKQVSRPGGLQSIKNLHVEQPPGLEKMFKSGSTANVKVEHVEGSELFNAYMKLKYKASK